MFEVHVVVDILNDYMFIVDFCYGSRAEKTFWLKLFFVPGADVKFGPKFSTPSN